MNKKAFISVFFLVGLAILFYMLKPKDNKRDPIMISSSASYLEMNLDYLIKNSDLIVIGSPDIIIPSRWNTSDGKLPKGTTVETIPSSLVIFTDVNFRVGQIIKGQNKGDVIRVRSLGGAVEQDQMTVSGVASLKMGKSYLLFLGQDTGSTAAIDPGHYFVKGGLQGLYEILDGKATSLREEWKLEELITYIQNSVSSEALSSTLTPAPTELLIETLTPSPAPADLPTQTPLSTETVNPTP